MASILDYIESHYPVEEISVNDRQCWPYLRWRYHYAYKTAEVAMHGESRSARMVRLDSGFGSAETIEAGGLAEPDLQVAERVSIGRRLRRVRLRATRRAMRRVKRIFRLVEVVCRGLSYGFRNWFRKHDYIVLTDDGIRKKVGDKYMNTFLDPIVDETGPGRVLCIEATPRFHRYRTGQVYTERVVSHTPLAVLAVLLRLARRLFVGRYKVANRWILDRIDADFGLRLNTDTQIELFEARRKVFSWLFRMMRPRALLLTYYYDARKMAAISAAKSLGMKVVELQHGVIGEEHPAYNISLDIDRSCFPDHLLVFGEHERANFSDSRFIEPDSVHAVGNYYIDYIRANCSPDPHLADRISGYKRVVGVTLQWLYGKRLTEFICDAAKLDRAILYMLIPRQGQLGAYARMLLPPNVVVIRDKGFYELMTYCDFHTTVNSTCAFEAPALGVQNILVDIDGSARRYYEDVLSDREITRFADTPEEYVDVVKSFPKLDRSLVLRLHKDFFADNYHDNIRRFVKTHLL